MSIRTPGTLVLKNDVISARQIAFAAAFLIPASKFLEVPSLLAKNAEGDLLIPALLHFIIQSAILFALLFAASRSEQTLFERLNEKFGKGVIVFYLLYAIYFVFAAILPLLDLEKYIYAVFFDTSPTVFSFGFFFIFSAYFCAKGIKSLGRAADICVFLFVIPFLALIGMSLTETDFTHLLPIFSNKFGDTMSALKYSVPHFSDAILLLPLIGNLKYKKGDTLKIMGGYATGAVSTLLFLAVFFSIFSSIAPREHYGFSKIAQYFPALSVVGRIDLLFVYLLTIVLLFFTCTPLLYSVDFTCRIIGTNKRSLFSAILNLSLFLFVLYCNKFYNFFYSLISGNLTLIFILIADMLPLFLLFLPKLEEGRKTRHA